MMESPALVAVKVTPILTATELAGVFPGVELIEILSPATTEKECVVSLQVVAAFATSHVKAVFVPFLITTKLKSFPLPGAVCNDI